MNFSSKEDIEAPIDAVFDMLSDFDAMERAAVRRGIEVTRDGPAAKKEVGQTWDLSFSFRGKPRDATIKLASYDPPSAMEFDSTSSGLDAKGVIELTELASNRTRMTISVALSAENLSARLLLQSLKLAKSNLNKRFKIRIADFAKNIEERHASAA